DVNPALLRAQAPGALDEVGRVGLVGADLLGGYDEIEVHRYVPTGLAEQLVVDVGHEAELVQLGELGELCRGSLERLPALHRVGQEARAGRFEFPLQATCDLDRSAAQDLCVE